MNPDSLKTKIKIGGVLALVLLAVTSYFVSNRSSQDLRSSAQVVATGGKFSVCGLNQRSPTP